MSDIITDGKSIIKNIVASKLPEAHLMIGFKLGMLRKNQQLHHAWKVVDSKSDRVSRHDKRRAWSIMRSLKLQLMLNISTWYINVQEGAISTKDVRMCLSKTLGSEARLLSKCIEKRSKDCHAKYHFDALNCIKFFKQCTDKESGDNRVHR